MKISNYLKLMILLCLGFTSLAWGQVTTFVYTGAAETYVVPASVTMISIEVSGGQGGNGSGGVGGLGATMYGEFVVTPGDNLEVVVGEAGSLFGNSGGGGGGSGVLFLGAPLVVAGGGGGGATNEVGYGGVITETAGSSSGAGGTGGAGGQKGFRTGDCGWASGGGGLTGDGYGGDGGWDGGALPGTLSGTGAGSSWAAGGAGGVNGGCTFTYPNAGAFGCGGGGAGSHGGAGGGGYSGGGAGQYVDVAGRRGGAGGGSYNDGTDQVNTAANNAGNGVVVITVLCDGLTTSVSATELCDGETVTLEATSINGGTISWDGGVVDGIAFTPPVGVSTYTATSDHIDDCDFQVDITVYALPTVTASVDDDEVCDGDMVTLSGGGAVSYLWDGGATDGVAFAPPTGLTTYTVTGTDVNTCENTASIDVTVHNLPTVTASADDDEVCDGDVVTLTGGGAATYSWDGGVTDGVAFTPPTGTTTYTVTGVDANTCENTASIDVTVHNLPTVTASVDDDEVCDGDMVTLTGGGAATYTWDGGATDGVAFAPPLGVTTYTVDGVDANGCENTASVDVTVHGLPTVTASVDDDEVCDGDLVILTGGGAATYTWDGGATDGVAFAPPVGLTTYTVTGVDGNGCENTASVDVTVHDLPTVTASVDDDEVCIGTAVTFNGGGAATYSWDMGVTDGTPIVLVEGTETYTVTGTDANGCVNSASVDVTVYGLPAVTATASESFICFGSSVTFNGGGATTYTWDMGVTDGIPFFPGAEGTETYTVVGVDDNGCENTDDVDVTVYPEIVVTYTTVDEVYGDDGEIDITVSGGLPGYVFDWDTDEADDFDDTEDLTGLAAGFYTVVVRDDNGCETTTVIEVVLSCTPLTVEVSAYSICENELLTLDATSVGGADINWDGGAIDGEAFYPESTGIVTYTAISEDGSDCPYSLDIEVLPAPIVNPTIGGEVYCDGDEVVLGVGGDADSHVWTPEDFFPPVGTTTYSVIGTNDETGCSSTAEIDVEVNPNPTVSGSVNYETICEGNNIVLTGSGTDSYEWMPGDIADGVGFDPGAVGSYTYEVIGTDENGCQDNALVDVTVVEGITLTYTSSEEVLGDDGEINLTVTGGVPTYTYDWNTDEPGDFDDDQDLTGISGGIYTVTVNGSTGCSAQAVVILGSQLSIDESILSHVNVYPNPTVNNVTITLEGEFTYEVTAINGDVLARGVAANQEVLSLDQFEAGTYFVKISSNGKTGSLSIVKQ